MNSNAYTKPAKQKTNILNKQGKKKYITKQEMRQMSIIIIIIICSTSLAIDQSAEMTAQHFSEVRPVKHRVQQKQLLCKNSCENVNNASCHVMQHILQCPSMNVTVTVTLCSSLHCTSGENHRHKCDQKVHRALGVQLTAGLVKLVGVLRHFQHK